MKNTTFTTTFIILLIIGALFASCKKCADCTRVWSSEQYQLLPDGTKLNYNFVAVSSTEPSFEACGNDEIKQAEKQIVNTDTNEFNGDVYISNTIGNCNCVVK